MGHDLNWTALQVLPSNFWIASSCSGVISDPGEPEMPKCQRANVVKHCSPVDYLMASLFYVKDLPRNHRTFLPGNVQRLWEHTFLAFLVCMLSATYLSTAHGPRLVFKSLSLCLQHFQPQQLRRQMACFEIVSALETFTSPARNLSSQNPSIPKSCYSCCNKRPCSKPDCLTGDHDATN